MSDIPVHESNPDVVIAAMADATVIAATTGGIPTFTMPVIMFADDYFKAQEDPEAVWTAAMNAALVRAGLPEDTPMQIPGFGMKVPGGIVLAGTEGEVFIPDEDLDPDRTTPVYAEDDAQAA